LSGARPGQLSGARETAGVVTTVVNLKGHRDDPDYAAVVYVGRAMHRGGWHLDASPLACPYRPGRDGSREQVVARYRDYLLADKALVRLARSLRGKRLGCWCAPLPCHADVIADVADGRAGRTVRP
jgi:hypothetical protein